MRFRRTYLAAALASLAFATGAQAQYTNIVTFGDSLSDGGTYGSRFTTNPGNVWIEMLAARLGLQLNTWVKGGTNFAQGGARVSQSPGITPPGAPERPVSAQITQYLAATGGKVDPGALVTVWAGANDVFVNLEAAGKGLITSAQVQANIQQAATDLVLQIGRLRAAGAQNIIVVNLPDIGITPQGLNAPATIKGTLTALSGLYNTILNQGLAQVGGNVLAVNASGLLAEVAANPSAYGFTNVTTPACKTASSITCTPADLRDPNAANTWLYADAVHPTTAGHKALSDVVAATLVAAAQISVLPEAALAAARSQGRVLESRQRATSGAAGNSSPVGVFVNVDFGKSSLASITDLETTSIAVGFDRRFGPLTAGAVVGVHSTKGDLLGSASNFKIDQPMISLFGSANFGAGYAGAHATLGDVRVRDINRAFAIGTGSRLENSSTGGTHAGFGFNGGWWMNMGGFQTGPFARLDFSQTSIKRFAEPGTSSTALSFSKQRRESVLGAIGWQIGGNLNGFTPFARISYEHDMRADARNVSIQNVSMGGAKFTTPGISPNESQVLVEAGVNAKLGAADVGLAFTGGVNRDSGSYSAINLGVRLPL